MSRIATIDETAAHFKVSRRTVQKLVAQGSIPTFAGLGRVTRIDLEAAERALQSH